MMYVRSKAIGVGPNPLDWTHVKHEINVISVSK